MDVFFNFLQSDLGTTILSLVVVTACPALGVTAKQMMTGKKIIEAVVDGIETTDSKAAKKEIAGKLAGGAAKKLKKVVERRTKDVLKV